MTEFIKEDEKNEVFKYIFILPGVPKKDINIDVTSNDELIISIKEGKYINSIEYKKWIPSNTRVEDIKAKMSNGILTVEVPFPKKTNIKID